MYIIYIYINMYHSNMFNGSSLLALKEGTMRPQGLQAVAISYIWNPLQPYQTSLVKKKWVQSIKMDLHQEWNYPLISGRLPMCHVIEPVTHILDGSIYMWYTVVWQMWDIMSHKEGDKIWWCDQWVYTMATEQKLHIWQTTGQGKYLSHSKSMAHHGFGTWTCQKPLNV
jgi:hypothetical protein